MVVLVPPEAKVLPSGEKEIQQTWPRGFPSASRQRPPCTRAPQSARFLALSAAVVEDPSGQSAVARVSLRLLLFEEGGSGRTSCGAARMAHQRELRSTRSE